MAKGGPLAGAASEDRRPLCTRRLSPFYPPNPAYVMEPPIFREGLFFLEMYSCAPEVLLTSQVPLNPFTLTTSINHHNHHLDMGCLEQMTGF